MIKRHHCITRKTGIPFSKGIDQWMAKISGSWYILIDGRWITCHNESLIATAEIFDRFKYPT